MRTNVLLLGMLVSALAGACGDKESDSPEGAAGAAGDSHSATGGTAGDEQKATGGKAGDDHPATGGTAGDEQKATGGKAGDDHQATGGNSGDDDDDDDEAGGHPGAAGSSAAAGGDDEPEPGTAGAGGAPDPGRSGAGPGGSAGDSGDDGGGTYGFSIRAPKEREVTCSENPMGSTDPALLTDEDFVCTFAYGSVEGYVYVQATPTDCRMLMGATPSSYDATGWISVDGDVSQLDGISYDHGGNHFNNTFEFDYGDRHYRIAHSTIGFGGRSCQPPDCVQVFEEDATTLVEDGCTKERTLPVTCVAIEEAGVVPSLADTFAPCPGDPNYSEEAQG
ncbi:MAG: hypothetical protein JW940_28255 [Polyangiaceae bacterium]|nr:hypothetical protein [Polyangiaceae bacterium]